jgi:hypothetical protein
MLAHRLEADHLREIQWQFLGEACRVALIVHIDPEDQLLLGLLGRVRVAQLGLRGLAKQLGQQALVLFGGQLLEVVDSAGSDYQVGHGRGCSVVVEHH